MGVDSSLKRRAVGLDGLACHYRLAYDERRTLLLPVGRGERAGDSHWVGGIYLNHIPAPCTVFGSRILVSDLVNLSRELHIVAVVEHHEIVKAKLAGYAAGPLRDLLLHTAVGDICIGLVRPHLAETSDQETLRDSAAYRHHVSLPERTGTVLHAALHVKLRMTRSDAAPLAELLQLLH